MIFARVKKWIWDIPREQSSVIKEQKSVKAEQLEVQSEQSSVNLDMLKDGMCDEVFVRKRALDKRCALLNERIGNLNIRIGDLNEMLYKGDRKGFGVDGTMDGRMPGE